MSDTENFTKKKNADVMPRKYEIHWPNTIILTYLHISCLMGIWYHITFQSNVRTLIFAFVQAIIGQLGNVIGSHRLWSHRSFKANLPLRIIIMAMCNLSWQRDIFTWARDHRVHHKYAETDADPHNAKRGFIYSHIGCWLTKKHPDVIKKGKGIDISDLRQDKVVMFQRRYYLQLIILNSFLLPTIVPIYFWGEIPWISWHGATCLSLVLSANSMFWVNSAAHIWGDKPYDRHIGPTQSQIPMVVSLGEGSHNYHHAFPWDYKSSESRWELRNMATAVINAFALIGWAYDLKEASPEMIRKKVARTGDGSWNGDITTVKEYFAQHYNHDDDKEKIWGWGDENLSKEDKNDIKITKRLIKPVGF